MRTSIFLGLVVIAAAISEKQIFTTNGDSDELALSIFFAIFIIMDIVEYVLNITKDNKQLRN